MMHTSNTNNSSSATSSLQSACAACKHQRKKCSEDCRLARYFPADRAKEFQAVHKVFGVSNVTKIIHNVKAEDRHKVVDSLIWEAQCRAKDPTLGAYGEYNRVKEQLHKQSSYNNNQTLIQNRNHHHHHHQLMPLPGQGGVSYRSPSQVGGGWNGISTTVSGKNQQLMNYNHTNHDDQDDHGGNMHSIVDHMDAIGNYASQFLQSPKNLKHEREVGAVVIPLQQQRQQQQLPIINGGFNQQYYIPGQFS